ncbi:MAG: methylaspartate mutase epsilon subunit [Bacillota bacterium]|nr:methylaspartate mutase epsilon subunit [Bacillota bacterium]MDK2856214.1 methylaspartate mutase epsilon subunit [Bacillota bacterium]MDK2925287.1 methylaspartate mutase epsilon subunit [Bacillota bacterium]
MAEAVNLPALGIRVAVEGFLAGLTGLPVPEAWRTNCAAICLSGLWPEEGEGKEALGEAAGEEQILKLREYTAGLPVEWGIELGQLDPRRAAEAAGTAGILTWRGGPLEAYLAVGRPGSLPDFLRNWAQVEDKARAYAEAGAGVRREVRGLKGTALVPPGLAVALALAEAALAYERGVRTVRVAYTPCGYLLQDVAAAAALRRLAPPGLSVEVTFLLWPGGSLAGPEGATTAGLWTAVTAALAGAERAEVAAVEGISSNSEAVAVLLAEAALLARLAGDQRASVQAAAREEEELIVAEAEAILGRIRELGQGKWGEGIAAALSEGSLDVPLAASGVCRGQALAARDAWGAVRFLDPGRLPFPPEVKEFHRRRLAERAQSEGRVPGVSLVIDDIYALNKGALVGRPE